MEVKWVTEGGYAGNPIVKTTTIPDQELDACGTEQARQDLIDECVQEDFKQIVTWTIVE